MVEWDDLIFEDSPVEEVLVDLISEILLETYSVEGLVDDEDDLVYVKEMISNRRSRSPLKKITLAQKRK